MRSVSKSRLPKAALCGAVALLLTGCEGQGFSGLKAEWSRQRVTGPFAIVSASHERAVVSAKGRQVAIEPAEGFCLAKESIETSGRSAFVLIGDCALDEATGKENRSARGELQLPRGVPGFITVSVSGSSGVPINGSQEATLNNLNEFFGTPDGRKLLGRGGNGTNVKVVESRRIGDGLYVLVEDKDEQPVPLLSAKFWRSFVQLNDRLAVVTMSGFRDSPLNNDDMLGHLVAQVKRLRAANRLPINEKQTVFAQNNVETRRQPKPEPTVGAQRISDLKPTAVVVTAETTGQKELWPLPAPKANPEFGSGGPSEETIEKAATLLGTPSVVPKSRPDANEPDTTETATPAVALQNPSASEETDSNAEVAGETATESATRNAPRQAPSAPRRPKRV